MRENPQFGITFLAVIHAPKYLCVVAFIVKRQQKKNERKITHKINSFVDYQLTCCHSLYFVSKF